MMAAKYFDRVVAIVFLGVLVTLAASASGLTATSVAAGRLPAATLWVARVGCEDVLKTNANGRVTAQVDLGCEVRSVAVGTDAVWFTTDTGSVLRVDPSSNEVVATIEVGSRSGALAVAPGGVWVSDIDAHEVVRIDSGSNAVTARIPLGSDQAPVVGLVADGDVVWAIQDFALGVARIDALTNSITDTVSLCGIGECRVGDAAVGMGRVWVIDCCTGEVREIDPVTLAVTTNASVKPGNWSITGDADEVWAVHADSGRLIRLEPSRTEPAQTVKTKAANARLPVLGAESVWFYSAGASQIVRVDGDEGRVVRRIEIDRVRSFAVAE